MQQDIKIPDIGGASGVDVIEIMIKVGDQVQIDTPLITLESDKASMEIPSPLAGIVSEIKLKIGDKVSEGDLILTLDVEKSEKSEKSEKPEQTEQIKQPVVEEKPVQINIQASAPEIVDIKNSGAILAAGPAVRRLAHTLGVDLTQVVGSGRKNRILKEDLEKFVRNKLASNNNSTGFGLPSMPVIDFSQFGTIETKPLNKIKRLTGQYVHRSWITIPHVTQFDLADITDLEAFRKQEVERAVNSDYKLTILAFVCKAVSYALAEFPQFNSSLDASGENLIYKKYCNIGIAVETPQGLVVPVIKNVNQLSVKDIAQEMSRLSKKAREKGLMPADMNGGCFTISSLGGIGGHAFTPIVNSPEVAILGLSRASMQPVYINDEFVPRLMLPLSLSYDHRVIDGAEGARFTRYLSEILSDIRRIIL
jgi:pyruvate dehydrogenase E2 component (dihydrolipoamide acetyltransferase)